jgi:hypothetical protein
LAVEYIERWTLVMVVGCYGGGQRSRRRASTASTPEVGELLELGGYDM